MCWLDGAAIPEELSALVRAGLDEGFTIERADFESVDPATVSMRLRLRVSLNLKKPEIWLVSLSYAASESTALDTNGTTEMREWFAMMLRTHITEWWHTKRQMPVTSAERLR